MTHITQQTFDIKDNKEELETIAVVLTLLSAKQVQGAIEVLITRQDKLMEKPKVIAYDPRVHQ